jgi:choline dehydrogenase-like flavoprotein
MIYTNKDIKSDITENVDVCIIGSGAGGAVVAKELAEKGLKVIVLEEGGYYTSKDFLKKPSEITRLLYRDAGSTMAIGMPVIMIPLGRCVGGTTVINSGTCFRIPPSVLRHWVREFGLSQLTPERLNPYFERVEKIINVTETPENLLGGSGTLIKKGAQNLGFKSGPISRNMKNCEGCGVCAFGCPTDAKQAMHVTYIPLASRYGAKIFANCRADKLLVSDGTVTGVEGTFLNDEEKPFFKIRVSSRITVVSCGAIYSPVFLKRNRVLKKSKHLGRHLHIHPATRVVAMFDEVVEGWKGVPQSFRIDEFFNQGIMLEGFFVPPGVGAGTLPFVGMRHKEIMSRYKNIASFGVMISDTSEGRVTIDHRENPLISYWLNKDDTKKILKGMATIAEVFLSAGAKEVYTGLVDLPLIKTQKEINTLYSGSIPSSHLELMAFHPMDTARMGRDSSNSVVNEFCETHEIKNLYIVDASIFPSSLGVNPQLSIMAFATYAADNIAKKLS